MARLLDSCTFNAFRDVSHRRERERTLLSGGFLANMEREAMEFTDDGFFSCTLNGNKAFQCGIPRHLHHQHSTNTTGGHLFAHSDVSRYNQALGPATASERTLESWRNEAAKGFF